VGEGGGGGDSVEDIADLGTVAFEVLIGDWFFVFGTAVSFAGGVECGG